MSWRYIAISESGKRNDIAVTDRLARVLLGLDGKCAENDKTFRKYMKDEDAEILYNREEEE